MSVFAGVGERSREGNDLIHEMTESGVIAKTAFVFGQMNEPPGARQRVGLTGLTMAEYFRDEEHRDVLLFIDNIFRFTQAGSEVSALLGRMPSAVGYQPNLATEMAGLQERITSTREGLDHLAPGGLRAGRRLHRPGAGDDVRPPRLDDPPRAQHRRARHLPGGRSADLDLARARPEHRRPGALRRRARDAARPAALPRPPGHHRHPRHRRAVRGGQVHGRPGAPPAALHEPAVLRRRGLHRPVRQVRHHQGHGRLLQGDPRRQDRHAAGAGLLPGRARSTTSARTPRSWRRERGAATSHRSARPTALRLRGARLGASPPPIAHVCRSDLCPPA